MSAKITVAGCGYVGLVTAACLADAGNAVAGYDTDIERIRALSRGKMPLFEPGLSELVGRTLERGDLRFTTEPGDACKGADFIFLALPTPLGADGTADVQVLYRAAEMLAPHLERNAMVVLKSTVPVGEAERIEARLRACSPMWRGEVAVNPEFLQEGAAIENFLRPDRVVIGTASEAAGAQLARLYEPFVRTGRPVLRVSRRSAELAKAAANLALAVRVSMMNELAALSEQLGVNIDEVRRIMGADSRIGSRYLFPGAGFGGSCLPKDTASILAQARNAGVEMPLASAVLAVNERQQGRLREKLAHLLDRPFADSRVALWGLSFKPETDDTREAPAVALGAWLLDEGARVAAFDPKVTSVPAALAHERFEIATGPYKAAEGAHVLAVMTEWNLFRHPDFVRLRQVMAVPAVLDARNLYDTTELAALGFAYAGIGAR